MADLATDMRLAMGGYDPVLLPCSSERRANTSRRPYQLHLLCAFSTQHLSASWRVSICCPLHAILCDWMSSFPMNMWHSKVHHPHLVLVVMYLEYHICFQSQLLSGHALVAIFVYVPSIFLLFTFCDVSYPAGPDRAKLINLHQLIEQTASLHTCGCLIGPSAVSNHFPLYTQLSQRATIAVNLPKVQPSTLGHV